MLVVLVRFQEPAIRFDSPSEGSITTLMQLKKIPTDSDMSVEISLCYRIFGQMCARLCSLP